MGQVLISDLDDETIAAYQQAAWRNERSLDAELREALRTFRPMTDEKREVARARLAEIRAMTPNMPQTPSEILVREDRDGFRD